MIYYYEMTLLLTAKPAACQTHPIQVREGNMARERRGRDEREEDGPVGSGACAAVLYPLLDTEEVVSSTKAVGKKVSSEQCEVLNSTQQRTTDAGV